MAPPTTFLATLRRVGPGMILAAAIVGSGELIATTTLGAQEGYRLLWLILLSCAVKTFVQAALGRYAIATGEPPLQSLDRVPGPRLRVGWVVWAWAAMALMVLVQVGAMFGGLAQVMALLVPGAPRAVWLLVFPSLSLALLLGSGYRRIERLALVKVGVFTLITAMAAVLLTRRPEFFSWAAVADGLRGHLPAAGLATAVAVFGVTGVGTGELVVYPHWCLEKGYARHAGTRDGSAGWTARARGWVRVMHFDIAASLVIYTAATIAFYLLGAGVLHGMGLVPQGNETILVLSRIYTETLGSWAMPVFLIGAIAVLYGSIYACTAAHAHLFADLARLLGRFSPDDTPARQRHRNRAVFLLTLIPPALYALFESPVAMVVVGATAQSLMLPVVAFAALYLQHRHLPHELRPPRWEMAALWAACLVIAGAMGYGVARL